MWWLHSLWRMLTQGALEQSTGKLEAAFFESVYRITYASGISISRKQGWAYMIYSNIVKLLIVMFVASELWYLFSVSSSLDGVIDNINVTLIHLIAMYRYKVMNDHKDIYKKLATSIESAPYFDVSTLKRKEVLEFWIKRGETYFKLLLVLGTCTLAFWYIFPLFDDLDHNLVVAVRLPFFYESPHLYAITYILVMLVFHYTSYFVIVNDLTIQAHLLHLICQFAVLDNCFENMLSDCSEDFKGLDDNRLIMNKRFRRDFIARLGRLVEQHKFLLNNSMELTKILSTPMLGQFAASSMLICLAGYQVTATLTSNIVKFLVSLLYLLYNMFELYVICRWCEEIKIKSEHIREAVYSSGWERGLAVIPGVRTRLMLVVARAGRPVVLSAGGLYELSLMSYTTLVKTSYSALTILLRARNR